MNKILKSALALLLSMTTLCFSACSIRGNGGSGSGDDTNIQQPDDGGNAGGNTGGDNTDGGNTGGNTGGDNTDGGNTGGNTGGDNTDGGNTGGNTGGDNTDGGNTGDNTGGDNTDGGNTGGNTGGDNTDGGNTGDNTGGDNTDGGNTGGNTGGDNTDGGNTGGNENEGEGGNEGGTVTPEQPLEPIFPDPKEEMPEATPMETGKEALIGTLKNTPYRSAVTNSELGLSAANLVGADERAFSRVLYPAPIGGVKTYNVADYGISPTGENNTRDFNALLHYLETVDGLKMVVFEKGTYTFKTTIELDGIEDLYIVGDETEFIYTTWCTAIQINDGKNIHLNGISIDFDPSAVVAGTVKSCNTSAKTITIQLYDEFSLKDSRYNGGKIKYGSYMEFRTDDKGTLYPNANGNLLYNSTGDQVENITGGTYNASTNELTLTFKSMKSAAAGTPVSVAFTMYEHAAIMVDDSENFYMEGCNLYSACGMGIKLSSVKNTYLNRTNLMLKAGSKRLMTATADGIHAKDCLGDLQLTGSIFENSHDDSINIASFYKNITAVGRRDKTITCEASSTQTNYPFEKGDVLEVYDPTTFELCATYKVMAVESSALTTIITVDKKVDETLVDKIVGNVTRSPKTKINDCIFRNKRNRGILLQTRNSDISGNTFQNIVHGPISVHSVRDIFAEAIVPQNITISNNKFINNNEGYGLSGDVAVFTKGTSNNASTNVIKNITVSNNFFYGSARDGIFFKSCGNGKIANNLLCYTGRVTNASYAMYVGSSSDVAVEYNSVVHDRTISIYKHENATITDNSNILTVLGGL